MTGISKILAVFVTVASLAFVGFAMASTFGGPDWSGVMEEDYLKGYAITKTVGADANWQAVRASDDGTVATSKVLPEVLAKVMDEVAQKQQQELNELREREPKLKAKIEQLRKLTAGDEVALQAYIESLRKRLAAINQQHDALAEKVTGMSLEASDLERQVVARRDDVTRLGQQVLEVEADLFRLKQIKGQLQDVDYQLQEQLDRAKERQQLLNENYNPMPDGA